MKVLTYMIQALCFVLKLFRWGSIKVLGEGLCMWVPSLEEWLLIPKKNGYCFYILSFLIYFLYTVVLILLDSSLVLCQMY